MKTSLLSVGIDIGTTTTHMVVSRLSLENQASATRIPELTIKEREIVYQSEIFMTPLKDQAIDGDGVASLLNQFYKQNKLDALQIDTGAVLITGESARARNARAVIDAIARLAGEFVVESAGPDLESALAARGSGAVAYSAMSGKTIVNIDIGGGTTNIALIASGKIIKTLGIKIGGRQVKLAWQDNTLEVTGATDGGLDLLQECQIKSQLLSTEQAEQLGNLQAKRLSFALGLSDAKQHANNDDARYLQQLSLTDEPLPPASLLSVQDVDEYWFSGGVAALMEVEQHNNSIPFNDLGYYFASAIKQQAKDWPKPIKVVASAIRATVIGAGMHSLQISGCTIDASASLLPLKNIRLLKVSTQGNLQSYIRSAFETLTFDLEQQNKPQALVLTDLALADLNYNKLQSLAHSLAEAINGLPEPIIIITKIDIAMSLSQILKGLIPNKRIITVDGIDVEDGDYLDIGLPLRNGDDISSAAIPIVVKTLLFYK